MPLFGDPSASFTSDSLTTTAATVSTSNTGLFTVDIPANAVVSGQVFKLNLFGTSSSTGTVTFRVHAGSNGNTTDTQVWISTTSSAQAANQRAGFDGLLTVRLAGSSGTVQCECIGFAHTAGLPTSVAATATALVNTVNGWSITLAASCSTGTFTAQQAAVEAI